MESSRELPLEGVNYAPRTGRFACETTAFRKPRRRPETVRAIPECTGTDTKNTEYWLWERIFET
jgi:hypothetical protein